jgi:hypothetical protein
LNNKKLGAGVMLVFVCLLLSIGVAGYINNALATPNMGPVFEDLFLINPSAFETPASLNVSVDILSGTGDPLPINQINITATARSTGYCGGCTVYANGSAIDCTATPLFIIKPGDTAHVDVVVLLKDNTQLSGKLHEVKTVEVQVATPHARFYRECNLSG